MTYSDDYAPSTSSFSGDQTGDIFGTPDTVPQSPVAAARVVDTQSGYMVVIKKKEERLALSVKRRIGTPPASHVLLTADESLQLSHVLDDSVKCLATPGDYFPNTISSQSPVNQGRRARHARKAALDASLLDTADSAPAMAEPASQREETHSHHGPDWDELNPSNKRRKRKQDDHLDNLTGLEDRSYLDGPPRTLKSMAAKYGAIAIGVILLACICIPMILAPSKYLNAAPPAAIDTVQQPDEFKQEASAAPIASEESEPTELNTIDDPANPLNAKSVDEFTRAYVANMLNFSPKGYRRAQIEAMAAMSPALMEKYWNETNFPVGIKDLPNEQKDVRIKKIVQEKATGKQLTVTVKGRLAGAGKGSPIALKLQIGVGPRGDLRVRQQTDLSSKK